MHRVRYAIPVEDLQKLNTEKNVEISWACDSVINHEVAEFSQEWLGEQIVDVQEFNEEQVLALFDKENAYLKDWSKDQKLNHIRNWNAGN